MEQILIRVTSYGANFNKGDVIWSKFTQNCCEYSKIAI